NLTLTASQSAASLTGATSSTINLNANTLTVGAATGSSTFAGVISGASGALTKDNASTQTLTGANTYTGATTISGGTLSTNSLADGGNSSGIGASTNAASNLVLDGGTLQYTGTAQTTDRNYTLTTTGGGFDGSGSGGLTIAGNMSASGSTGSQTLTLSGSNADNVVSGTMSNGTGSNVTNVTKTGTG